MSTASAIHKRRDQVLGVTARHGAGNVCLFGSAARGEDTPDSDIDLLISRYWLAIQFDGLFDKPSIRNRSV